MLPLVSVIITLLYYVAKIIIIVKCGIVRFLCVMHVFEVQASSSSLDYLCAKFSFFHGLHCSAVPWRKIAYSLTHPAYLIPQELKLVLQKMIHEAFNLSTMNNGVMFMSCCWLKALIILICFTGKLTSGAKVDTTTFFYLCSFFRHSCSFCLQSFMSTILFCC